MSHQQLTGKERVIRSIRHQEVDRIPSFLLSTPKINTELAKRFNIHPDRLSYMDPGHGELLECLGCDVRFVWPQWRPPSPDCKPFSCGSVHASIHNGTKVYEKMPLEDAEGVDDILKYDRWPSPDWFDCKIPSWMLSELKGQAVCAYDMFMLLLYAMGLRGMEGFMIDMAANNEMAHAVLGKITQFNMERLRRFLGANEGMIDIVGIGDDVAGQDGMFFSLDMWREYIKPCLQQAVDVCNEFNVTPYFHGCGGLSVLYDDFIEMGITCTGRLQTEAKGNVFSEIKKTFGKDLCLWGAVDGQHVAIEGTPEEVREHVQELIRNNYDGTGFVCGPTHSFTEDTPVENIVAVYDALKIV